MSWSDEGNNVSANTNKNKALLRFYDIELCKNRVYKIKLTSLVSTSTQRYRAWDRLSIEAIHKCMQSDRYAPEFQIQNIDNNARYSAQIPIL